MKKNQRQWLGIAVAAVILVVAVWHFSHGSDLQQFSWQTVWGLLIHASLPWLGAAVALNYTSYLLRAYRWKCFLDPIKPSSLGILFSGQVLGFSAVFLIGRPGELVRPAYIARWEGVPFTSQLAILVLERIFDSVAMALLFAAGLYLQPLNLGGEHAARTLHRMHLGAFWVLVGTGVLVVSLVIFRLRANQLIPWAGQRLRFLPLKLHRVLAGIARSFAEGLDVIQNWRDLGLSMLSTAVLWTVNVTVFFFVFHSLGGQLADLSWWAATVVVFMAGLGLVVQLPGVGGGFQVALFGTLQQIFGIPAASATSAAVLQTLVTMYSCIALGVVMLIYGGLTFKHLREMAQAEKAAVPHHGTTDSL